MSEAEVLLRAGLFDGAYYLAGYAVECALKACIAKQTKEFDFPDLKLVNKAYTHNLDTLLGVAGLRDELDENMRSDRTFRAYWAVVKDWSEEARYQRHEERKARDFCEAVANGEKGVLRWLRGHW